MHDPIGAFSRIRAFYLSYLDTASRLEPAEIRAERRSLLMETGTLCTSPLLCLSHCPPGKQMGAASRIS